MVSANINYKKILDSSFGAINVNCDARAILFKFREYEVNQPFIFQEHFSEPLFVGIAYT